MEILCKYPELSKQFEKLCRTRRDEILAHMVETNSEYNVLRNTRAETSMKLRSTLGEKYEMLESYAEAVYAQESYELGVVYRHGFLDALDTLTDQ